MQQDEAHMLQVSSIWAESPVIERTVLEVRSPRAEAFQVFSSTTLLCHAKHHIRIPEVTVLLMSQVCEWLEAVLVSMLCLVYKAWDNLASICDGGVALRSCTCIEHSKSLYHLRKTLRMLDMYQEGLNHYGTQLCIQAYRKGWTNTVRVLPF